MKKEVLYIVIPVLILLTLAFFFKGDITGLVTAEERYKVIVTLKNVDSSLLAGAAIAELDAQSEINLMKIKTAAVQSEVIDDVNSGGLFGFLKDDDLVVEKKYGVVPAMVVYVNEDGLLDLLNNPLVESVSSDYTFSINLGASIPLINATSLSQFGVSGDNVSVCVIDTGIDYTHAAFENRIVAQKCYCANDCCPNSQSVDDDALDDNVVSHGTHVSGIVGANGTVRGVAPNANIVAVKVCNNQGTCYTSDIISGIDFCVQNKVNYNIHAISGSIGDGGQHIPSTCPTFIDSALDAANNIGMFLVFASGNNGYNNGINYPACYADAISVAASSKADAMASFSNRGPGLNVVAPGVNIYSTAIGGYGTLSGTSQATPHVSGFVALLVEFANKFNLSRTDIFDALNKTNVLIEGFPRIDVGMGLSYLANLVNYTPPLPPVINNPPGLNVVSPLNNSKISNPVEFKASASDVEDGELNVSWFLVNNSYYGNFTLNLSVGNYSIIASVSDSDNATINTTIFFEVFNQTIPPVNNAPVVEIISPANNSFIGRNITLIANVSDEDLNLSGSWLSNLQGSLGHGNEINVLLSEGSHIISFEVTDSGNLTTVQEINLYVGSCLIDFDKNTNSQLDIGDVVVLFNEFLNNSLTDTSGTFCSQSGTCLIEFDRNVNTIYDIGDMVLIFNGFLNNNLTTPAGNNCFP